MVLILVKLKRNNEKYFIIEYFYLLDFEYPGRREKGLIQIDLSNENFILIVIGVDWRDSPKRRQTKIHTDYAKFVSIRRNLFSKMNKFDPYLRFCFRNIRKRS